MVQVKALLDVCVNLNVQADVNVGRQTLLVILNVMLVVIVIISKFSKAENNWEKNLNSLCRVELATKNIL